MILMATALEPIVFARPACVHPPGASGGAMMVAMLGPFGDAIDFIFQQRESQAGTVQVGGLGEIWDLTLTHLELSLAATLVATLVAMPIGAWLGHIGRYQFLAISTSNIGRAVPALGLVVFFIAFLGVGFVNVCLALVVLAIPPILTNTYVGVRGVDPETVDAANGNGMTGRLVARQIELPLALPTIMAGIRISLLSVIATATIAPLANVDTLGRPIVSPSVYGTDGQLAACIVVALVTFAADGALALLQRALTPRGLKLHAERRSLGRPALLPTKSGVRRI
jgi:osmoprotectant transport system permease protein